MAQSNFFPERPDLTPQIYAYTEPQYEGQLKIGYTARDVQKRVAAQYSTKRPGEELPYKIVEYDEEKNTVFLERAIVAERLRLAIGLPVRNVEDHEPISKGIEDAVKEERFYEPPLVNIIDFACNR